MLKAMRKNLKALAPTLWLVIIAFIITIFAVWGGAGRITGRKAADYIAVVGKDKITAPVYRNILMQRLEILKNRTKQELNRKLIEQLNLPQQVLNQMVQEIIILNLAKKMGIDATDEELRNKIMSYEVFQRNGKFVGFEEYKRILNWNRISIEEFENSLRREIVIDKVIKLITAGLPVTDEEVFENYKKENESAEIEYLIFNIEKMKIDEEPTDAQLEKYFSENQEKYKIPEKRKGEYVFVKLEDLKPEFQITEEEIKKYYQENIARFKVPEKIKVSRIYLPYNEENKNNVKEKAQEILEGIKKGEDFAQLAKLYSQDEKKEKGGDWGEFEWRRLSSIEQEKIKELSEEEVSDLIELEDGFSIIKITEKEPSQTKTLEEVRGIIKDNLLFEKAGKLAEERITKLEKEARKDKSLKKAAKKMNYKVESTGLLKKGDAIEGIDPSGLISQSLFKLKKEELSSPIYTYQGIGLVQLKEIQPSHKAKFDEVKEEVKENLIKKLKKEKAFELAQKIKRELNLAKKDMEEVSKKFEIEFKKEDEFKRGNSLPSVGFNQQIEERIFSFEVNKISEPIEFSKGYVLVKVLNRKEISQEDFQKHKEEEREKLRNAKRNKFFNSYFANIMGKTKIKLNFQLFEEVNNEILSRFER